MDNQNTEAWRGQPCPTCGLTMSLFHPDHAETVAVRRADLLQFIEAVDNVAQYESRIWRIRNRLIEIAQSEGNRDG
jgi:hypothetical protein